MKKFLLYSLKWELGSLVMIPVLLYIPTDNVILKTIIGNFIGAIIFFRIDKWIFSRDKKER